MKTQPLHMLLKRHVPQEYLNLHFVQTLQTSVAKMLHRHGPTALRSRMAIAASVSESLRLLVQASSVRQALWGLASAGPQNSLRYAMAKAKKGRG